VAREPDHAEARGADTRYRVSEIAIDLFIARGFDHVTVGEIAEAAGVSRRTLFRLFAAKEEIAFPDHEGRRRRQRELLDAAAPDADPLETLAAAGEHLLADFLEHRELVLKRYELTRTDARVREREIVENAGYVRASRRYLRDRYDPDPPTPPGASDVIAVMFDGIHAAVLRRWVRSGGTTDAARELREHFRWALALLRTAPPTGDAAPRVIEPAVLAVLPATERSLAFIEQVSALAREQGLS
jgi:AcrR family transcriptional regulator